VLDLKTVGRVAQLVEQRPFKAWVAGSIPAALTNNEGPSLRSGFRRAAQTPRGHLKFDSCRAHQF
jgi:hypothetical protein